MSNSAYSVSSDGVIRPNTQTLMKVLQFDAQDLEANRTGLVSNSQINRLKREFYTLAAFLWFCAVSGVGYTLLHSDTNMILVCTPVTLFFIVCIILITLALHRVISSLQTRCVKPLYGSLTRRCYFQIGRPGGWRYKLKLANMEFEVNRTVYETFIEGDNYILYYIPMRHTLLSAEYIDP